MKQNKGIIENWQIAYQKFPLSMCLTIEDTIKNVVIGDINGKSFKTSPIIKIVGNELETENSYYTLGTPKDDYRDIW